MGRAYQSMHAFIKARMQKCEDYVSVILYNTKPYIICKKEQMSTDLVTRCMKYGCGGGTNFENVLCFYQ